MCIVESTAPISGTESGCEPGPSPSAAYAESVSPLEIESRYCLTTLPASVENAPSASTAAAAAGGGGALVAADGAADTGAEAGATAGAAGAGRCIAAVARGRAVCAGVGENSGAGGDAVSLAFATIAPSFVACGRTLGFADAWALSLGRGDGVDVASRTGVARTAFFGTPGIGVGTAVASSASVASANGDDVAFAIVSLEP